MIIGRKVYKKIIFMGKIEKILRVIILGILFLCGIFNGVVNAEGAEHKVGRLKGLGSATLQLKVGDITPYGANIIDSSAKGTEGVVNFVLGVAIENMIVVFGVIALVIMTIGGGHMIFHVGEETLLTRGKTMFVRGVISLAIALSAGILVQLVRFILYNE